MFGFSSGLGLWLWSLGGQGDVLLFNFRISLLQAFQFQAVGTMAQRSGPASILQSHGGLACWGALTVQSKTC